MIILYKHLFHNLTYAFLRNLTKIKQQMFEKLSIFISQNIDSLNYLDCAADVLYDRKWSLWYTEFIIPLPQEEVYCEREGLLSIHYS